MGPNDVGILRGIIGDGQSMNKEEMGERILGKKPNNGEKKSFLKFPPDKQQFANNHNTGFNPTQALEQFTGKNKSSRTPMDTMNYFTGKGRVNTVSPTAALDYFIGRNNIRADKFSHNAEQPTTQPARDTKLDNQINEAILAKMKELRAKKIDKSDSAIYSKSAIPKDAETRKAVLESNAQAIILKRGAEAARAQAEIDAIDQANRPPTNKDVRLQTIESSTFRLPEIFTSATKRTGAGALGDMVDTVRGVSSIVSGRENVNTRITPGRVSVSMLVPTRSGLKDFAAGLAENLGSSIASGNVLIGPFEPRGGTQQIRDAQRTYVAYVETLNKRHKGGGDINKILSKSSEAEKLKLEKLRGTIALRQQQVAGAGFMGGQGGAAMLMSNVPRGNMNRFTELGGAFTRQSYGNYGPEASAQMGVGQGLRADQPNKWGVLLGQNTGTAKITQILGKQPDPMGESQAQKIQKLSVPMRSGEEAAAKIKRLSGM